MPRKRESRPAITSAAIRACRFAGPASAIRLHSPVTKSLHLDGVADGEDVGVARAHLLVDPDPATLADLDPGHRRERGVRADAEREDHEVGRIALAGLRRHGQRLVLGLLEPGDAVVEHDVDAVELEEVRDEPPVLPIERGQDLIGQLDHRHVEPAMNQVLRHLEADEPAADDDRVPGRPHRLEPGVLLHPGEEARPSLDPLTDLPRVRHGPHREDARAGRSRAAADGSTPPRARARACRSDSVVTSPVATSRSCTVLSFAEIPIASQPVRQSTANCSRNTRSFATSRSDSCSITPPTWYGNPQFAYETYGPRSTITISACSSSRRSRAAHDAPPATPPTMITFIVLTSTSKRLAVFRARLAGRFAHPVPGLDEQRYDGPRAARPRVGDFTRVKANAACDAAALQAWSSGVRIAGIAERQPQPPMTGSPSPISFAPRKRNSTVITAALCTASHPFIASRAERAFSPPTK